MPTVVVDGLAVATWRSERRGDRLVLTVNPFTDARDDAVRTGLDSDAADIGRFLGLDVTWA